MTKPSAVLHSVIATVKPAVPIGSSSTRPSDAGPRARGRGRAPSSARSRRRSADDRRSIGRRPRARRERARAWRSSGRASSVISTSGMPTSVIARPIESDSAVTANVNVGDPQRQAEHEIEEVLPVWARPGSGAKRDLGGGESCHGDQADLPRSFQPRGNPATPACGWPQRHRSSAMATRIVGHRALLTGDLSGTSCDDRGCCRPRRSASCPRPGTAPGSSARTSCSATAPTASSWPRGPAHGEPHRASRSTATAGRATWSFRPDAGAPAEDGFELRLSGPGGTADPARDGPRHPARAEHRAPVPAGLGGAAHRRQRPGRRRALPLLLGLRERHVRPRRRRPRRAPRRSAHRARRRRRRRRRLPRGATAPRPPAARSRRPSGPPTTSAPAPPTRR